MAHSYCCHCLPCKIIILHSVKLHKYKLQFFIFYFCIQSFFANVVVPESTSFEAYKEEEILEINCLQFLFSIFLNSTPFI